LNKIRQCFRIDAKRFLYRLLWDGRIPHLEKIKRLVRLLLDIKTDFLPLPSGVDELSSVSLRQSGIEAKIDTVASGSRTIDLVCVLFVKPVQ
jgi:hypothetical protein